MPHISTYITLADGSERTLAASFRTVGDGHAAQADVFHMCQLLAKMSDSHVHALSPVIERYHEQAQGDDVREPERLHASGLARVRAGQIGLLRDLQDLHVLATLVQTTWTVLSQAAQGLRDQELFGITTACNTETSRQLSWLNTRMKAAAPQVLIVAP